MKLIAVDLDGTLLNSRHQITNQNKEALQQAYKKKQIIVIATGRSLFSVKELFAELAISGYIIALNGSYIARIDEKQQITELFKKTVDRNKIQQAFEIAMQEKVTFIASSESVSDRVLVEEDVELVQEFLITRPDLKNWTMAEMKQRLQEVDRVYLKVAFTNRQTEKLIQLRKKLQTVGIATIFSDTNYIEMLPEGTNKGTALEKLCGFVDISLAETIAFGDQENDIEMLQVAGIGVAMGNAQPHVKACADRVTADNEQSGVALKLKELS